MPRPIGRSRLPITPICFGTMDRRGLGADARADLVRAALDLGIRTLDTAPLYEFGDSERWVGRALKGRRDEAVVATKVGLRWGPDARGRELFGCPDGEGGWRSVRIDGRPEAVRADVEASLQRLAIDTIDLVQVHHHDHGVPVAETMGALLELRSEGKLREIGVSNFDLAAIEACSESLGDVGLAAVQLPLSLVDQRALGDIVPWAERKQVGILAYSPLAEGLLAGRYLRQPYDPDADSPLHHPRNAIPVTQALGERLAPVAEAHGIAIPTLALAVLIRWSGVSSAVVGASARRHLEVAAAAAGIELSEQTCTEVRQSFAELALDPRAGLRRRDRWMRSLRRKLARFRNLAS